MGPSGSQLQPRSGFQVPSVHRLRAAAAADAVASYHANEPHAAEASLTVAHLAGVSLTAILLEIPPIRYSNSSLRWLPGSQIRAKGTSSMDWERVQQKEMQR